MGVLNNGSEKRERVIDNRKKRCLVFRIWCLVRKLPTKKNFVDFLSFFYHFMLCYGFPYTLYTDCQTPFLYTLDPIPCTLIYPKPYTLFFYSFPIALPLLPNRFAIVQQLFIYFSTLRYLRRFLLLFSILYYLFSFFLCALYPAHPLP